MSWARLSGYDPGFVVAEVLAEMRDIAASLSYRAYLSDAFFQKPLKKWSHFDDKSLVIETFEPR